MTATLEKPTIVRLNGNGHSRKPATPRSMVPKTVREQKPVMAQAIDIPVLVLQVAQRKASLGVTFSNRSKLGDLLNGVRAEWKRRSNVAATERVPDAIDKSLQREVETFWAHIQDRFVNEFPELVSFRLNVPVIRTDDKDNVVSCEWGATQRRARATKDIRDERVMLRESLRALNERLERMNKATGERAYTREEFDAIKSVIAGRERRIHAIGVELGEIKAPVKSKAKAKRK